MVRDGRINKMKDFNDETDALCRPYFSFPAHEHWGSRGGTPY
jgi:hypothetical protein